MTHFLKLYSQLSLAVSEKETFFFFPQVRNSYSCCTWKVPPILKEIMLSSSICHPNLSLSDCIQCVLLTLMLAVWIYFSWPVCILTIIWSLHQHRLVNQKPAGAKLFTFSMDLSSSLESAKYRHTLELLAPPWQGFWNSVYNHGFHIAQTHPYLRNFTTLTSSFITVLCRSKRAFFSRKIVLWKMSVSHYAVLFMLLYNKK